MPLLTGPVTVAGRTAPSRVLFGPHETNLGRDRAIGDRHVAYYAARAAGGTGLLVTEIASVTGDDWPYERAPLAADCGPGWAAVAAACRPHGTLVLAGLGHAGLQGSSAYSQAVLWAPSPVADVITRELPATLETDRIASIVAGFGAAAALAVRSGLAGVEVDAAANSLIRQFLSGLTNQRDDDYGTDRLRFLREVLAAVRAAIGPDHILGLRLSCDEDAPWAGITPELAAGFVDAVAADLDLLVVTKGSLYSSAPYRPTAHTPAQFNVELCRAMTGAAAGRVPVVLQGSVVDPVAAQGALDDGVADLVEMTRAQIAEPRLVALVRAGTADQVRPCILCNQACRVRDNRNPIVSCVGEPRSGHETVEPDPVGVDTAKTVLVVGGGPAGLEAARVLAGRGHTVRLVERTGRLGGVLRTAATGPGRERLALLAGWLESECRRLGVAITLDTEVTADDLAAADAAGERIVLATGSRPAGRRYVPVDGQAEGHPAFDAPAAGESPVVLDVLDVLSGAVEPPPGPIVIHDPIGGPIAVALAEQLSAAGRDDLAVVSPDQMLATQLALTGDLADANFRLLAAGVKRELRTLIRQVGHGRVVLEDVWSGLRRELPAGSVIDCGHRLPDEALYLAHAVGRPGGSVARAGDCVAPRTVLDAVLEGRRRALEVGADVPPAGHLTRTPRRQELAHR